MTLLIFRYINYVLGTLRHAEKHICLCTSRGGGEFTTEYLKPTRALIPLQQQQMSHSAS